MDSNRAPDRLSRCDRYLLGGSKSFAFGNAIVLLVGLIFSIYLMVITFGPMSEPVGGVNPDLARKSDGDLFYPLLAIICFSISLTGIIFAVILCCGLSKKSFVLLKAYIIYGAIVIILTMVGILVFVIMYWNSDWGLVIRIPPLVTGICVLYALILWMIGGTAGRFARYKPTEREEDKLSHCSEDET